MEIDATQCGQLKLSLTFELEGWTEQPYFRRKIKLNQRLLHAKYPQIDVLEGEIAWGYGGTGPHNLAKVILYELCGPKFLKNHPGLVHNLVCELICNLAKVDEPFHWQGTVTI